MATGFPRHPPSGVEKNARCVFALAADVLIMTVLVLVGVVGGSLTILAEAIRVVLMIGDRGLRLR